VEGRLKRDFVEDIKGRLVEVNGLGKAIRDGEQIVIIGESKAQLSRKHVDNFLKRLKFIGPAMKGEKFLLMVTHMTRPEVAAYAGEKGTKIYYSYEF